MPAAMQRKACSSISRAKALKALDVVRANLSGWFHTIDNIASAESRWVDASVDASDPCRYLVPDIIQDFARVRGTCNAVMCEAYSNVSQGKKDLPAISTPAATHVAGIDMWGVGKQTVSQLFGLAGHLELSEQQTAFEALERAGKAVSQAMGALAVAEGGVAPIVETAGPSPDPKAANNRAKISGNATYHKRVAADWALLAGVAKTAAALAGSTVKSEMESGVAATRSLVAERYGRPRAEAFAAD